MFFYEKEDPGDIENGDGGYSLLPGDLSMKAFVPVRYEAGEMELYMVTIENKARFDHVRELVADSLFAKSLKL